MNKLLWQFLEHWDYERKLLIVTCINVPEGVSEADVRKTLLDEFGFEIAASLGHLQEKIRRIGTMWYNCRKEITYHVLFVLEAVLICMV